ncbi:hypothetical protein ANO11243_059670 [Dothideomycetidae sp. 11243]|nr:hypothetical protein ANO11243_059670 [fungal sp. No.11243]
MSSLLQQAAKRKFWEEIAAVKRAERAALLKEHSLSSRISEHDLKITNIADVSELTNSMRLGNVTAEDVVRAYIHKAIQAHEKTNCLTEINFDGAIAQAKDLDSFWKETGRLKGPLHGVPISVKDQFNIKGFDSTLGYTSLAFSPASSDCVLVDVLRRLGAVIIAKTNLPQSIMWCETENPLWGLTTHPSNAKLTPGGSSGGEATLLSEHGSLIGWGTDIGGSIRIPSHMNGLWGLKPSSARMPYQGVAVSIDGQQHVPSAVGPMARSLTSLIEVTRLVIKEQLWFEDAALMPMPWRDDVFEDSARKKLVIGIMPDDGTVRVHPPVARVFRELVGSLRNAGHETVEWDTSLNSECIAIMDEFYSADGGEDIRRAVERGGEPFLPHVAALINRGQPISVYEYWQVNKRKVAAQQAYLKLWNSTRSPSGQVVDVLLCPTMPHTAVPHRACRWTGYTKLFNFLDYTALSFPAGEVSKDLDTAVLEEDYTPRNDLDAYNWGLYDLKEMDGLDIGLQIVGRKLEEEKVLGVALQIQDLMMTRK